MNFPDRNEYSDYFNNYVKLLPHTSPLILLQRSYDYMIDILNNVPVELYDYRYAEGKWTIKDLLIHLIDCEQILSYRALRFARNDFANPLLFDEDNYVSAAETEHLEWNYILESLAKTRNHTLHLFKGFSINQTERGGSENFPNTVRAIAAIISGHTLHHIYVLQDRYLKTNINYFKI